MFRQIALVCVWATLMAAPIAWAEEDESFGEDDEAQMSNEEEAPEQVVEAAADAPAVEPPPTETADAPAVETPPTEPATASAVEKPPTETATPARGAFDLNDGNQPGDGPPASLPPDGNPSLRD